MTYYLTVFITSFSVCFTLAPRTASCGPPTQRKHAVMLSDDARCVLLTPPAAATLPRRWLANVLFCVIIKHRESSHHSHNENDSHLNIVVKENLKRSNDAELIKTSCDERGVQMGWDAVHINTNTQAGARHQNSYFISYPPGV